MPTLTPVKSSSIAAIGHDLEKQELHVQFHSGATYVYSGVSAEKHQAFVDADSIGSHFQRHVRDNHPQRKIPG